MLISCVIPTYKRESLLREAVWSVLNQDATGVNVEVIVVNDAGEHIAAADWQRDGRVKIYDTYRTERSVARNTGAALSRGEYLHFLDDDDILLPGAYDALASAARANSQAVLITGRYEALISGEERVITIAPILDKRLFARLVAGIGIPLGCCLVERRAFFRVGGFDTTLNVMEDLELLQRLVLEGPVAAADSVVARFRMGRHQFSTTDWKISSDACRLQREKAFGMRGVAYALRNSLCHPGSAYTRGRLVRFCIGSALRNIRELALATSCQRLAMGLSLCFGGLVRADFWRGLASIGDTEADLGEQLERS